MTLEDQCRDIIEHVDAATIASIRKDAELFNEWKDCGNDFIALCELMIEQGADAAFQNRLIELQTIMQKI